jgi:hypothetical protein
MSINDSITPPQKLRFAARNAAISASEMRTRRPNGCTGSTPPFVRHIEKLCRFIIGPELGGGCTPRGVADAPRGCPGTRLDGRSFFRPHLPCCAGCAFAVALPLKTRALSDAAPDADPIEVRTPSFRPSFVKHRARNTLRRAKLIDRKGWVVDRRVRRFATSGRSVF